MALLHAVDLGLKLKFNILLKKVLLMLVGSKWGKKQEISFQVKYSNNGFDDDIQDSDLNIDANQLAISLLGISKIIELSNNLVNGDTAQTTVKISGSFKTGSFIVSITTGIGAYSFQDFVNVLTLIGFPGAASATGYSLIKLVKILKGGKIVEKQEHDNENFKITVTGSSDVLIINKSLVQLYESPPARKELVNVVEPLKSPEINNIIFSSEGSEPEKISKEDLPYFSIPEPEIISENEVDEILTVIQSNLNGNSTGWRFGLGEGDSGYLFTVLDEKFLSDVKKGKYSFVHGTKAHVRYKITLSKLTRLNPLREIIKVYELYSPNNGAPTDQKQQKLDTE